MSSDDKQTTQPKSGPWCVFRVVSRWTKKTISGGAMREVNGVPRAKKKTESEKIRRE
jgi:hypothetical protein